MRKPWKRRMRRRWKGRVGQRLGKGWQKREEEEPFASNHVRSEGYQMTVSSKEEGKKESKRDESHSFFLSLLSLFLPSISHLVPSIIIQVRYFFFLSLSSLLHSFPLLSRLVPCLIQAFYFPNPVFNTLLTPYPVTYYLFPECPRGCGLTLDSVHIRSQRRKSGTEGK